MVAKKTSRKFSGALFVFLSILVQFASIFIFYSIFYGIGSIFREPFANNHGDGIGFYALTLTYLSFFVLFFTIIVTSVQEVTKSELLASVMHGVAILFIWSSTEHEFYRRPYDFGLILICIALTFPVRIFFRKYFYR